MKPIPRRRLIPVITDLLEYSDAANNTIAYTKGMVDRYGDVCDVSFTGIRSFFIHEPEIIKEMLTTQSGKFKRTRLFRAFRKFLGDGLFTSDGDFHKQQRRLIKPAFYPQRVAEYASIMVQCAGDEMDTWVAGSTININLAMTNITLQVITKTLFGSQLAPELAERVNRDMPLAFAVMGEIVQNPFYVYCLEKEIKIPVVKRFFKIKARLVEVIDHIISTYRKEENTGKLDLLSMLMEARDEDTGSGMTDRQIRDEVMTFFLAGHETTTLALSWTLYLLGKHPEIAGRFRDEVKNVIGNRKPVAADYQALHLTKNIFKESLRLYPPAWTFARECTEDLIIKDYHFPKGSVLWTVTYLVHHDKKHFHDPEDFIPDRWDEEQIKELPKYAYFPFGGGNRMCIGEGFAWMEGVLVLAAIASRFRLTLPDGFVAEVRPMFSLKMKEPVFMKVEQL